MPAPLPSILLLAALLLPACSGDEAAPQLVQVHINGRLLDAAQIAQFQEQYGMPPAEGRLWYDSKSGMFGAEGQPAAGFMFAGHDLGPLAADASRGATQVFVNGRHLPATEVQALAALAGGAIAPGRYWLDAQLSWGYEGSPMAAGNLLLLAMAQRQAGGGGGDNNWSSLLGSGNWDSGGSRGYVSIPGVGPIGSYGVD